MADYSEYYFKDLLETIEEGCQKIGEKEGLRDSLFLCNFAVKMYGNSPSYDNNTRQSIP